MCGQQKGQNRAKSHVTDIKKKIGVKRAGRHFSFLKRAGHHQKAAGRRTLQKRPRQNTEYCYHERGTVLGMALPPKGGILENDVKYPIVVLRRDRTLNYFSIMVRKRLKHDEEAATEADAEDGAKKGGDSKKKKKSKDFVSRERQFNPLQRIFSYFVCSLVNN